ncbi:MAG: hydroxyacid dehydrogenase [Candidatus Omnitrophica bacterium]|nr:hydroxyacid dehydrogenase [Candidatus Omnitrophota bacterium]
MALKIAIGPSSFAQEDSTPLDLLMKAGLEIVPNPFGRRLTEDEIIEHLKGVDGLIAGLEPLNRKVIESAPQLKAIARVGIGVTNVDFQAAQDCEVKVSNTPDPPAVAVAELTLAALLALARKLPSSNEALHRKEWKKEIGFGLKGSTVLIIGFGRIGRRVAKLLHAFEAEVIVFDPFVEATSLGEGVTSVTLEEGLAQADAVSLHASGTECVLGEKELSLMKPGAILLNSARGELVDEQALLGALKSERLSGAWFDAFWEEPYTGELCGMNQVLMTPHVGTYTRQCRLEMESEAVNNLLRDLGVAGGSQ